MKKTAFILLMLTLPVIGIFAQDISLDEVHVPDAARVSLLNDYPRVAIAQWKEVGDNEYSVQFRLFRNKQWFKARFDSQGHRVQLPSEATPQALPAQTKKATEKKLPKYSNSTNMRAEVSGITPL